MEPYVEAQGTASHMPLAIIDDDPDERESFAELVKDAGFQPVLIEGRHTNVRNLYEALMEKKVQGALCDHRLSNRGFAQFNGAEFVAHCYEKHLPAFLVTHFENQDADVHIRLYRRKIPVLLPRDKAEPEVIYDAVQRCRAEISGNIAPVRQPHRTLLEIVARTDDARVPVVDAFIPAWNPRQAIRFPTSLAGELEPRLQPGAFFFARVNIEADRSEDLFLVDFEVAEEPDGDGL